MDEVWRDPLMQQSELFSQRFARPNLMRPGRFRCIHRATVPISARALSVIAPVQGCQCCRTRLHSPAVTFPAFAFPPLFSRRLRLATLRSGGGSMDAAIMSSPEVVIRDPGLLEKTKEAIRNAGTSKLQVRDLIFCPLSSLMLLNIFFLGL